MTPSEIAKGLSLPVNISPDGREVWDWAARLSNRVHLVSKARELYSKITRVGAECGACKKWMTRECRYEKNVKGRNVGPSMKSPACGGFVINPSDVKLLEQWQSELAAVRAIIEQESRGE